MNNKDVKLEIGVTPKPNFEWKIGDNYTHAFIVERTLYNRFKWWISTKLFLPGTYKWI